MTIRRNFLILTALTWWRMSCPLCAQDSGGNLRVVDYQSVTTGAMRTDLYFPYLEGKPVGLTCNHTSRIGPKHLADSLVSAGFDLQVIFTPEHGFRGNYSAGEEIGKQGDDHPAGRIVSLYGPKKKPAPADLAGIDWMIFDIQDVGVRFYTYISTLALVMEACAEAGVPVIVLDRPNPNGFYIDGPVLDTSLRSFVGMHPVPVVYGMTIGEYAMMINGEGWLKDGVRCNLHVIPMENYDRGSIVKLPVIPSPNLPTWQSVYLYPSLCLFEGTVVSVGRGTDRPFEVIGHPDVKTGSFAFTPRSIPGVADKPPYEGKTCYGQSLEDFAGNYAHNDFHFSIGFLVSYFQELNLGEKFFNSYFDKLSGDRSLKKAILSGDSIDEIRDSWQEKRDGFIYIRSKYLLYADF